jgi:hypothetical protein
MRKTKKEKAAEKIVEEVQHKAEEIEKGTITPEEFVEEEADITGDIIKKKR